MRKFLITQFRKLAGTERLFNSQYALLEEILVQKRKIDEISKALLFLSTIANSLWLKNKSFSPGGWAADFSFLYTLYRVLNDTNPKKIVEFGLGQTTKIISQYCDSMNCDAFTFEHDDQWIKFFKKSFDISNKLTIQLSNITTVKYKGFETLRYADNVQNITGNKIELIVLDGPYGSDGFSRTQIFDLIPNAINKDQFCLLIDDYQRIGEKNTANEIMKILTDNKIEFLQQEYSGEKTHFLLCSSKLHFLTTL